MRFPQLRQILVAVGIFACCTTPARSELRVAAPAVDLGAVRGGQQLTHRFELANSGAKTIEVLAVEPGCGCLAPKLEQRLIAPGGKTTLTLELRTLGQADGPHTWNAKVQYRAGQETKTLSLSLRGMVQSEIIVQPAILGLHVATTVQQEITLIDTRPTPLRVVDVDVRAAGVKLTHLVRDGKTTKIVVTADGAQLRPGRHEGVLSITTDDADYGQLRIPIVVTKTAATSVRCVPESIELRPAPGATTASAVARLRSVNDQPVRIKKIEPSDAGLICTWAPGPGNDATVRVRTQVSAETAAATHHVIAIHLESSAADIVSIPVTVRTGE